MTKVGVFDSGIGGMSVVNAIKEAMPDVEVVFANDEQHVPYGTRSMSEVHQFVTPILQNLVEQGCEVIVVACNTVTTNLIDWLRREISVPLIGMEPMVKVAAQQTKSKKIVVCATPATLSSPRYAWLKEEYAAGITIFEPDCRDWSSLIESNEINQKHITAQIDQPIKLGADVIVLGCTHYHWIEDDIRKVAKGRALVMQPEQPVIAELKRVLGQQS